MIVDQKQMQDKIQSLVKALEQIANESNWQEHTPENYNEDEYIYGLEVGKYYAAKTARKALKEFYDH
jgi:hypothetical protein